MPYQLDSPMKRTLAILCVLLACGSTGCKVVRWNAYRTLLAEPKQFDWRKDRCQSRTLYRSWAADAWQEHCTDGCARQTSDYVIGFQDGFVEYCYFGGTTEPPPVPPRPYWNPLNRSSPLSEDAEEWFAGYRHGAQVARDGGYRQQAVVPVSVLTGCCGEDSPSAGCCGARGPMELMTVPLGPMLEPMPAPAPTPTPTPIQGAPLPAPTPEPGELTLPLVAPSGLPLEAHLPKPNARREPPQEPLAMTPPASRLEVQPPTPEPIDLAAGLVEDNQPPPAGSQPSKPRNPHRWNDFVR